MSDSSSMPKASLTLARAPFITFYSFKGGVGRSMALFNVAGILAGRGFRVLVIDFDLEAPGISYLLRNQAPQHPALAGLVDLLEGAVRDGDAADLFKCTPSEVIDAYTHPYALPTDLIRDPDGELRILPAGILDERYQRRLDVLDLPGLYREGHGKPLMEEFKKIISDSARFDIVLVDSRTGFSDESGICTRDLADHIVVVTGLNHQNVEGTAAYLRALHEATGGKRDLLFVLSPVPMGEDELMDRREKAAQNAFSSAWQGPVDLSARIYYHPRLALTEEPHVFRSSRGPLYEAYSALERRIRTSIGLTNKRISDDVSEAILSRQFDRAIERSRMLAKLDDGGRSVVNLILMHQERLKGIPEGDFLLKFLIDHLPPNANLHNIAVTLHFGKHPLAGYVYERALEMTPNDADTLGNFALFFHNVREDYDVAETYYRKALSADPFHATVLGSYAAFLEAIRNDYDGAETYYRKSLDVDPDHAANLGNYADFLHVIRRDIDGAVTYYRKAIAANPKHSNNLGNFARLLFGQNRCDEGNIFLERAFAAVSSGEDALLCELHFYAYAHGGERWPDALGSLKRLLTSGARSPGWDLQANVQRARESGHPDPELLAALADVVADAAPLATLEAFEAWQQAT